VSLPSSASNELMTDTSTGYSVEPKLQEQRELHELQTLAMGESEDYMPVKHKETPEATEALKKVASKISEELVPLKKIVMDSLRELGTPILDAEIRYNEGIGLYALAILDCDARQALEYWLKIVDEVHKYDIPVFITWTGSINVTPEEMGIYIADVLAKMNMFLVTEKPIDIIRIIEEEWGL